MLFDILALVLLNVVFLLNVVLTAGLHARSHRIMAAIDDLNAKIAEITQIVTDLGTAIDAFIVSDAANFEALKAALAANDPAAIEAAVATLETARAALAGKKDAVVAADAADNLPPGP